ncbi:integrase/recombinase XerD [Paraburkholderia sp. EB58]|jgi:integrase/recombinase XerD|uniref:tyrosine-type recombinase/integrase n=1 Tax=Paraburkholderia sp. EB58 TaxID=3035125 RepID=UPI003D1C5AE5
MESKRAKVLTAAKFRHLLRVTEVTSRFPDRDALILLLGVTCGMRVTEIARIEIRDVLTKSGARREDVSLRGSITKGCRPRCIYLAQSPRSTAISNDATGAAMDRREYRGLMPHTRLIFTQKGSAFELSVKRRVNFDGETVEFLAADSLQSYVTGLYRAAGLGAGHSSHSGRRTFASRLVAQGHSLDTVKLLLGHSHLDHVGLYLKVTRRERSEAIATFDGVFDKD